MDTSSSEYIDKILIDTLEIVDEVSPEGYVKKRVRFQDYNSPFFLIQAGYDEHVTRTNTRANSTLWCVEYITDGEGTIIYNDREYTVKKGDAYILHHGSYHSYKPKKSNPYSKIHINAMGTFIKHCIEYYNLSDPAVVHAPKLRGIFEEFCDCAAKKHDKISDKSAECALIFLNIIQEIAKITDAAEYTINYKLGKMIKNYIDKSADPGINLSSVCNALFCTKASAIHSFQEYYGITPYKYITDKKLSAAKKYLETTNLPIYQIAEKLHFCSSSYLSRFFKRETGISPNIYRKENRK